MLLILSTDVITGVVVPVLTGLIDFMHGLQKAFQPAIDAVKWLTTGIAKLFEWLSDHLVGHSVIPDMVRSIVGWFAGLPGKAIAALGNIAVRLGNVMVSATNRMINATRVGLKAVLSWIGDLPGRAVDALGDLSGVLVHAGKALMSGLISGITSKIGSLTSTLSHVTSLIPLHKGPPGKDAILLRPAGRLIMGGLVDGITDGEAPLARKLASISGGLAAPLGGGLGSLAVSGGSGSGGAAYAAGPQQVVVKFDVSGADEDMKRLIRRMVSKTSGGGPNSVQRTFG
jgi:hypothetical protein